MPELPEVESVRRVLEPQLAGRTIVRTRLLWPGIAAHPAPEDFINGTEGQRIAAMTRRGKFLGLRFASGAELVLHLRMTGQLLRTPADFPEEKHTHAVFSLDDGGELRYLDLRRFGRFWLLAAGENDDVTGRAGLGPEPFDAVVSGDYLRDKLGRSRRAVKSCLLDQSVLAGIGNIYADESLFRAGIRPARPACDLSDAEWIRLAAVIPAVLQEAIDTIAWTPEEYLRTRGLEYRNTPLLQAYGRAGQPCGRCGAPMESLRVGGRTSCFCPNCQK